MKEAREKEESLKAKKKSDPNELKVYTKGVGKFLNPAIKKQARQLNKQIHIYAPTCQLTSKGLSQD